jgi:DNA polymerase I-like protein with 3'-5' exonuclease and polymerase domains
MARTMPPIPDTGWAAPNYFPDLSGAKALCIDVETYDPELNERGPGWARGVGHIVGIAVGVQDGPRWYFPMRHEVRPDENMDPQKVLMWAQNEFSNPAQPKVGANITYDVGWLRQEGVKVQGKLYDVQFAEALLSETATVNLEDLGHRYLGEGKETDLLFEWCDAFYGGPKTKWRSNIYRAPPSLVGPYAESDVDLPFRVLEKQWPLLYNEGLLDLFDIENRLIYLMVEMRFAGVRIDIDKAERLLDRMVEEVDSIDKQIEEMVGFPVNINASTSIAAAFDSLGVSYGMTKTGKPSFTKKFLNSVKHPLAELLVQKREREKLRGTFIQGYLLDSQVNGKVYGSFHQVKGESGGAGSGRFSSSNPNLQNIPIRTDLGREIREAFVPDEGHLRWVKADYSQIEYRGLAHYAVGPGADEVRHRYQSDPTTDFHTIVQELIRTIAKQELDRPLVKNVNFGVTYGMGEPGLARDINLPIGKAKELFAAIHGAAPFLKATMDATMREADELGYITTVLGRRSRFNLWEPAYYQGDHRPKALPYDKAILAYRNPRRAYLHKSLNRRLQGSAADLIKMAMLKAWEGGVFDETGVPRLTVHDELDFSDPGGADTAFRELYHIMETAIPFKVPIQVGVEVGPSWGTVQKINVPLTNTR